MSADLNTSITLRGEKDDLLEMLKVLRAFETKTHDRQTGHYYGYIEMVKVSGNSKTCKPERLDDLDLQEFLSKAGNELTVEASGPWGRFAHPEETELFEALADAAPNAFFDGNISGFVTGADVGHYGRLENGLLCLENYYRANEDNIDAYIKYLKKKISRLKFCKLFKIDKDEFDMERYNMFIKEAIDYDFPDIDYDTFIALCGSKADEEQFANAMKTLAEQEIMDFYSFSDSDEAWDIFLSNPVYYNPISKKYRRKK